MVLNFVFGLIGFVVVVMAGLITYFILRIKKKRENLSTPSSDTPPEWVQPWDKPVPGVTQQDIDSAFQECLSSLQDPTDWLKCCEGVQKHYGGEATECSELFTI